MNALTFRVELIQPLLVGQLENGEENSTKTLTYIPGSVVRGLLIERFLRRNPAVKEPVAHTLCRQLFFTDRVRFLNAYPLHASGTRMLPTPRSWRVAKEDSTTIYDFAVDERVELDGPKPPPGAFCWRGKNTEIGDPERTINVHNASDARQLKRQGSSTVFQYEALASGEHLGAVILADDSSLLEDHIRPLLQPAGAQMGGSRSAGYGRVAIGDVRLLTDWQEFTPDDEAEDERIIVTLLSDTILRTPDGQPTTDVAAALGWKPKSAFVATGVTGGFNRKWNLPLVQMPVVRAGSVFVFDANTIDPTLLQQAQQQGVGERRVDGFGRIAVNWQGMTDFPTRLVARRTLPTPGKLTETSQKLAQAMAERRLRTRLEARLLAEVGQLQITNRPQNTQLARLRVILRRSQRTPDLQLMTQHLQNLKAADQQFRDARIDGQPLKRWLLHAAQQPEQFWRQYFAPSSAALPVVAGEAANITPELRLEYVVRLLDAVFNQAIRTNREGGK